MHKRASFEAHRGRARRSGKVVLVALLAVAVVATVVWCRSPRQELHTVDAPPPSPLAATPPARPTELLWSATVRGDIEVAPGGYVVLTGETVAVRDALRRVHRRRETVGHDGGGRLADGAVANGDGPRRKRCRARREGRPRGRPRPLRQRRFQRVSGRPVHRGLRDRIRRRPRRPRRGLRLPSSVDRNGSGRLLCVVARGGLEVGCYDLSGRPRWHRHDEPIDVRDLGAILVLADETLLVVTDVGPPRLVGYRLTDGEPVFDVDTPDMVEPTVAHYGDGVLALVSSRLDVGSRIAVFGDQSPR